MLLTKREEQLLKAFLKYGKLSVNQLTEILQVSKRTTYRTIADLTESLHTNQIGVLRESGKYYLSGELDQLKHYQYQKSYSQRERLSQISLSLLMESKPLTNEWLQEVFLVSNVTIIQDIASIEERFKAFDLRLHRQGGYSLEGDQGLKRWLAAVILTQSLAVSDFSKLDQVKLSWFNVKQFKIAKKLFEQISEQLPECDTIMGHFLIVLLSLANANQLDLQSRPVSREALDLTQSLFNDYAKQTGQFFNLQEILYFAQRLDEFVIKRQPMPLFQEQMDSEFYYNISNLIDKVSLYTKINFAKDQILFKFLFNHIRLSLAVPEMFGESSQNTIAHSALKHSSYLHRVVSLLVKDIFPPYLQTENEYELITLHFASSLRRSPDIYPIRLLLLTDERPLARELLVTRIKHLAPFIERLSVASPSQIEMTAIQQYDAVLTTQPTTEDFYFIPIYPDGKELLALQDFLQGVQENREVVVRDDLPIEASFDVQDYLVVSQSLLQHFNVYQVANVGSFEEAVATVVSVLPGIADYDYLSAKLIQRFEQSPMAIPETGLMLLHTQSSSVKQSGFYVCELEQPVTAISMNGEPEVITRVLVMLTGISESDTVRELMTAIGQSIIENHLYTEIYKTGNKAIIYQLLNQIFTENIKKMEN
ncbi:BglG family transcription antiterminator [Streptococcus jiangjianxini]|uniref:BglG family transcription antiterminator n=1 Tax=Streptococcus jiangjianxini TaxID=3161189 RepID=UPI0032EFF454